MRKKLIAANWKMYKTPVEARQFVAAFLPRLEKTLRDDVVLCPPFVCLADVADALKASSVGLGAQDLYWEKEGAYTGEISAEMLLAVGCSHVILGHSERRQYFGETDESVNRKLKAALAAHLTPIVCVGEVLKEREEGRTDEVLRRQCTGAFGDLTAEQGLRLTVAYEPVWAIGTGKTATPKMASQAHQVIRGLAAKSFGQEVADNLRILYGGSVKPENAAALMSEPEIDGALVGGASLDPKSFAAIVHY